MRLGIMQPYFLPYIGYFQLLRAVDRFVFLDDVAFIKKGWIHRNRLQIGGKEHLFTIPIRDASQNRTIQETSLAADPAWRTKLERTVQGAYAKAPLFDAVFPLFQEIVRLETDSISTLAIHSVRTVASYLQIETPTTLSSQTHGGSPLRAQERILEICKREGASHYINPIGGTELYDASLFAASGIELSFIRSVAVPYRQADADFLPFLSILDVLMLNSKEEILSQLESFSLQKP